MLEILNIPRVGLQLASEVPCLIQVISEAGGFVGFTAEFVELQWEFEWEGTREVIYKEKNWLACQQEFFPLFYITFME